MLDTLEEVENSVDENMVNFFNIVSHNQIDPKKCSIIIKPNNDVVSDKKE